MTFAVGTSVAFFTSWLFPASNKPDNGSQTRGLIVGPLPTAPTSFTYAIWNPNTSQFDSHTISALVYSVQYNGGIASLPQSFLPPFGGDTIVDAFAEDARHPSPDVLDVQASVTAGNN
jgi:hypothetical protein